MSKKTEKTTRRKALSLLRKSLQDPQADFRENQWEAIDRLVNKRRKRLVVERTGWGKSAIYFIATRILRDRGMGPTIIVSPLLALMRDQRATAKRMNIEAEIINSDNEGEWKEIEERINKDIVDLLLISPERLSNDKFLSNVLDTISDKVGLFVVDEAHCISDWGHDFRPDYQRLVSILKNIPPTVPVLATTATANDRVIEDVQRQLGDIEVKRGPLMRKSLVLETIRLPLPAERLTWLATNLTKLDGTGIIYTSTKKDADQVAKWLRSQNISAYAYYSGVTSENFANSSEYREHLEEKLLSNRVKALVATTSLGMGIDKPDLGFVIHYQAPGSIIDYYQQVGRAGRAIQEAFGVLLSGGEDEDIQAYFREIAFPTTKEINELVAALRGQDGLTKDEIMSSVNIGSNRIDDVAKFLLVENPCPIIKNGGKYRLAAVDYRRDNELIDRLTKQREDEWKELQEYIDSKECLMRFLARALDDENPQVCGKCAVCKGATTIDKSDKCQPKLREQANIFLRQSELPIFPRLQIYKKYFPQYCNESIFPEYHKFWKVDDPAEGRALSRFGVPIWGAMVLEDKKSEYFRDELVDAMVQMIQQRWNPKPHPPEWVTCVPSTNHPKLVPNFAERLADQLRLPFVQAVSKIKENQPQKIQTNVYCWARNLDGVFATEENLPPGPCLLVDDIVHSRWTLTVISQLLRKKGVARVWPATLAKVGTY